jgi:TetR/AcrR family transcriptional repressor of nem operon
VKASTQQLILDTARDLLQTRGVHGFSYRDVAARIGIRTASIHYHFPSKDDMVVAVADATLEEFRQVTARAEAQTTDVIQQLEAFAAMFATTFARGDRICPICMLAVCQESVSTRVQSAVAQFWRECESWLERVLMRGASNGALAADVDMREAARVWVAALEGSMVTGRVFGDAARVTRTFNFLLRQVRPVSGQARG